jgi:hypothetical protein
MSFYSDKNFEWFTKLFSFQTLNIEGEENDGNNLIKKKLMESLKIHKFEIPGINYQEFS